MTTKVLVTDGSYKNALAILRSLGKRPEYSVDVVTHLPKPLTLCRWSKYCRSVLSVDSRGTARLDDTESYAMELLRIVEAGRYDVLLPVGLISYLAVCRYGRSFSEAVHTIVPPLQSMEVAVNKEMTVWFAERLGIPVPSFKVLGAEQDVEAPSSYPVVIKSSDGVMAYCNNEDEFHRSLASVRQRTSMSRILVQEYVHGFGCGFFGLYDNGELVAHFLHKRIKEYPSTGGPSAVAESYYDERLYRYGRRLCDELKWHGPIMAEFKYDLRDGEYKLIELNPKLWGSLDLTISAGIDVPGMLVDIALGKRPRKATSYRYVRYRWLFPDEFKSVVVYPCAENLKGLLDFGGPVKTNLDFDDPGPFLFQVLRSLVEIPVALVGRYPHGRVLE